MKFIFLASMIVIGLAGLNIQPAPSFTPGPIHSYYIKMPDGVRIAVDVVLPGGNTTGKRFPAILEMTRYWRSATGDTLTSHEMEYAAHGYAVVTGDVRGTGASSGKWYYHRSRAETRDFGDVISWIARQPWSNGEVSGWGLSYSANTADWMPERQNPALKAIVPRFPDYDPYADLYFPGGVPNRWMAETWGTAVKKMDLNQRLDAKGRPLPGVRPVDADHAGKLLQQALAERKDVPSVWEGLRRVRFRDDRPPTWNGASMNDWGIYSVKDKIEKSGVPMQVWGSWYDSGTANGVLHRFMTESNPQRVYIGAWVHGAFRDADPFDARSGLPSPSSAAQQKFDRDFLAGRLAGKQLNPNKLLTYYTVGSHRWKTTATWPLPGTLMQTWFLGAKFGFSRTPPPANESPDHYQVDFTASTGNTNRWHTNGGVGEVWYGDRAAEDHKALIYTSEPLSHDTEITGEPVADLYIASDRNDGAFFVYLEDVAPDGKVTYVTEGELHGIDRKVKKAGLYHVTGPDHSFRRADSMAMVPGKVMNLQFSLMPISVLIHKGHRLRIALAGADADTFERIPGVGDVNWQVYRSIGYASKISLPVVHD